MQQSQKDLALEKDAAEKAKRVREAQERRDRERREKTARTNAIVDMNNGILNSSSLDVITVRHKYTCCGKIVESLSNT